MRNKLFFLLVLLAIGWRSPAGAEDSFVLAGRTQVFPSTTVPVAEEAQIAFQLSSNEKISISSFSAPALDDFQITKSQITPVKAAGDKWETGVVLHFLPLSTGEKTFPSLPLAVKRENGQEGRFETPPVKLEVINALANQAAPELLKDIKGPVGPGWFGMFALVLAALGLIALAVWFAAKRKKKPAEPEAPKEQPRPPDEVALEKLARAWEEYRRTADLKLFYTELSNVFREYLSANYAMDALEKTTSEIFSEMRGKNIDRKKCLECREALGACDLVKFAKFAPDEKQIEEDMNRIKAYIESESRNPEAPAQEPDQKPDAAVPKS